MELVDTRPMGGGVLGFFKSKQGPDPIANRASLTKLGKASPGAYDVAGFRTSIEEGNKLREVEMVRKIKGESGPLLVQLGDHHVDSVAAGVGPEAVPVERGADFDAAVTKR